MPRGTFISIRDVINENGNLILARRKNTESGQTLLLRKV